MKLSLRALELLFDASEQKIIDKAQSNNWNRSDIPDKEVINYNIPSVEIDKQLDYILSNPKLITKYSIKLSQNPLTILEIGKSLPKQMITKFEKIIITKFEKKKITKFEKKPECEESLRNFSNNVNNSVQDTDTKEDNTVPNDHCAKSKIPQLPENKKDTQMAQCTVPTTVPNEENSSNPITPLNTKHLENSDSNRKLQTTVPNFKEMDDNKISLNLEQLENSQEWLDVETTIALGVSKRRTLFRKIKDKSILSVKASKPEGGSKTFINVNSLPVESQQKWKMHLAEKHGSGKELSIISSGFAKQPKETQLRAFAKETIIKTYLERREEAKKQGLKLQLIDMYFQKDLDQKLILTDQLKTLGKFNISPVDLIDNRKEHILSLKVIKKWLKLWNDADQDIAVLCDKYSSCGRKRSWSREMEGYIAKLAIHPNEYTFKQIYNKTCDLFGSDTPNYQAVKRYIKTVVMPQNRSLQAFVKGKKAVKKNSPYVPRINDAFPGEISISDGYVNKFLVYSPYHKHPDRSKRILLRPVVVYWLDTATELITGYAASYSERFDVVISSFDHAVSQYGVPKGIMTDNAGSYHNVQTDPELYAKKKKDSAGKRTAEKLLKSGYPGFFQDIGVERIIWVTPGNPQSKKIEPYNHKIFDEFERDQFTYTGKTHEERPERMNMTNHVLIKKHGDKIMTWEEYLGALEEHIEKWNNTKRKHLNNMSAKDYYLDYTSHNQPIQLSPEERFLKLSARKILKLRGKQLELLGNLYRHPSFEAFIDTEIQVIYNAKDLYSVHIATVEGRLLEGKAQLVTYGSQTNQIQTADAIHAKNYYEKQNKAVYLEIIQMGGLTNKLKPAEIDQAVHKGLQHLEAEESLRIDNKIKNIHKDTSTEMDQIKSKKDPKPKKIHKPRNPRPLMAELDKANLERIENEENEEDKLSPEEKYAKELVARLTKERGLKPKRRRTN